MKAGDFRRVDLPGTRSATKMTLAPDGTLFFGGMSSGEVWTWDPKTSASASLGSVPVIREGTHFGLLGLAVDPDFAANKWIYLHYSGPPKAIPGKPVSNQIWRYAVANGRLDMAAGRMLLEYGVDSNRESGLSFDHSGGAMAFDAHGNLYFSTGENAWWALDYGNIDETRIQYNSMRSSANTQDLRGKIVRIKPTPDGRYTIPPGNLFPPGMDSTRPEIFAMGFRNPWSLNVDRYTGTVTWADVGTGGPRYDPDRGPAGTDEFGATRTPGFFGWPMFTGPNLPYNNYDYASNRPREFFRPEAPVNASRWNTGLKHLPPARPSIVSYAWDGRDNPWPGFQQVSRVPVTGPIYHYDGRNPSPFKLPPHFDGKWFVGDAYQKFIKVIEMDAEATQALFVADAFPGVSFSSSSQWSMMGMEIGPDGALYVNQNGDRTFRIEYTGTCRPATPVLPELPPASVAMPSRTGGGGSEALALFLLPPTGERKVFLARGTAGFTLYDLQGRKVWSHRRSGPLEAAVVAVPEGIGAGTLLRGWTRNHE